MRRGGSFAWRAPHLCAPLALVALCAGAAGAVAAIHSEPAAQDRPFGNERAGRDPSALGEVQPLSDRSRIVARLDCGSTLNRRELTLFGNGTLRLRAGEPGREGMSLAELGPDELDEAIAQLSAVDLDETDAAATGPEGAWVDRCTLELALPERDPEVRTFKRFDSISLALSRAVDLLEGLAARVEEPRAPGESEDPPRLPVDYRPRIGDVLRHLDGTLYRVIAFTSDGEGIELQGVDQPLAIYIAADRLAEEMTALVRSRETP